MVDPGGTATGSVKFAGWSVPDDVDAGSLKIGDPTTTVTIENRGQNGFLTFSGEAGDRIQLQSTEAAFTSGGMSWNVELPDGATWQNKYSWFSGNKLTSAWTLPKSGTYKIVVNPGGTATGSVKFRAFIAS